MASYRFENGAAFRHPHRASVWWAYLIGVGVGLIAGIVLGNTYAQHRAAKLRAAFSSIPPGDIHFKWCEPGRCSAPIMIVRDGVVIEQRT